MRIRSFYGEYCKKNCFSVVVRVVENIAGTAEVRLYRMYIYTTRTDKNESDVLAFIDIRHTQRERNAVPTPYTRPSLDSVEIPFSSGR